MRAHIIEAGMVVNTVVVSELLPGMVDANLGGTIGDSWDGTVFTSPTPVLIVPESITRWQALTILNQTGLLDAVEAYVGSLTDRQAQIDFSAASIWRRDWPWIGDASTVLGLSSGQVDQMFIAAAGAVRGDNDKMHAAGR